MTYFDKAIGLSKIFGQTLEYPNAQNAQCWREKIENELSPENLTCDGELPRHEVQKKQRTLLAALKELDVLQGIQRPTDRVSRQVRTEIRKTRLQEAVKTGFAIGTKVKLTNGIIGEIIKINRTRFAVKGHDGREWSAAPVHCKLV